MNDDVMIAAFERYNLSDRFEFIERIKESDHQRKCRIRCRECGSEFETWAIDELRKGRQSRLICPECGKVSDGNDIFTRTKSAERAAELYTQGLEQSEIADLLGCTVSDVGNAAKKFKIVDKSRKYRAIQKANKRRVKDASARIIETAKHRKYELLEDWIGRDHKYLIRNIETGKIETRSGNSILRPGSRGRDRRVKLAKVEKQPGITIDSLIRRDGNRCYICGKETDFGDKRWGNYGPDYPTIDHVIPISKGGKHVWNNVRVCCGRCNNLKGNKMEGQYEQTC